MLKRKSVTLIAAALAMSFGGYAAAEDKVKAEAKTEAKTDGGIPGIEIDRVPGDRVGVPGIDVDITARMGELDKDADRRISKVEAAGNVELKAQFATLDTNKDGQLDKSEYAKFKAKTALKNDKDNHGTDVSAVAKDKDKGGVPGIDVDRVPGDRVGVPGIDVDLTARLGKLDTDGDKSISKAEAKTDAKLKADFSKLDTNKDGKLDSGEFARFEVKAEVEKK